MERHMDEWGKLTFYLQRMTKTGILPTISIQYQPEK